MSGQGMTMFIESDEINPTFVPNTLQKDERAAFALLPADLPAGRKLALFRVGQHRLGTNLMGEGERTNIDFG